MRINNFNRVLTIDFDESLIEALSVKLLKAGFIVDSSPTTTDNFTLASQHPYDALILDTGLNVNNVFETCESLRANGVLTPILMLSGNRDEYSTIHGLEVGADEYICKPISNNELIARVSALVRRNNKSFTTRWLSRSGLDLDLNTNIVQLAENAVCLTKKEAELLHRLMGDTPAIISREQLLKDVWGIKEDHTSNRLDVYIRRLRDKLKTINADYLVQTLRGSGYFFGVDEQVGVKRMT